jgi:hypothetical protein
LQKLEPGGILSGVDTKPLAAAQQRRQRCDADALA